MSASRVFCPSEANGWEFWWEWTMERSVHRVTVFDLVQVCLGIVQYRIEGLNQSVARPRHILLTVLVHHMVRWRATWPCSLVGRAADSYTVVEAKDLEESKRLGKDLAEKVKKSLKK